MAQICLKLASFKALLRAHSPLLSVSLQRNDLSESEECPRQERAMLGCHPKLEKGLKQMDPMLVIPNTKKAQVGYEGNHEILPLSKFNFCVVTLTFLHCYSLPLRKAKECFGEGYKGFQLFNAHL